MRPYCAFFHFLLFPLALMRFYFVLVSGSFPFTPIQLTHTHTYTNTWFIFYRIYHQISIVSRGYFNRINTCYLYLLFHGKLNCRYCYRPRSRSRRPPRRRLYVSINFMCYISNSNFNGDYFAILF